MRRQAARAAALVAILGIGLADVAWAQDLGTSTFNRTPRQRQADDKLFIDTRHADGVSFGEYRTFAWIPVDETLRSPVLYQHPQLKDWIRNGVDEALAAGGFSTTSYGDADFTLAYQVSIREVSVLRKHRFREASHSFSRGRIPRWREITQVEQMPEGTLLLEIVDPDEDAVVWMGRVAGLIADDVTDRGVAEAIAELLQRFPPK